MFNNYWLVAIPVFMILAIVVGWKQFTVAETVRGYKIIKRMYKDNVCKALAVVAGVVFGGLLIVGSGHGIAEIFFGMPAAADDLMGVSFAVIFVTGTISLFFGLLILGLCRFSGGVRREFLKKGRKGKRRHRSAIRRNPSIAGR